MPQDLHRIQDEVTAVLEGAELWTQLKQFQNEMVVGPQGRYLFELSFQRLLSWLLFL